MIRQAYRDPRYVVLLIVLIAISGIAGFTTRPKLEDPNSKVRWGYITTYYPGASPSEVESRVSEPIERALREAKAIRTINSSSLRGVSIIAVRLTDEVEEVSGSWIKIQDKLSEVAGTLPSRASMPALVYERRWEAYTSVVALVDTSASPTQPAVLSRWAKELENRLRFVPGTRFTELFGLPEEEVLVEITEESLAATALTPSDIARKIRERDSETPDATSQTERSTVPVRLTGDIDDLDRLRSVVLRGTEEGSPLRLRDVATVYRSERLPSKTTSFVGGDRAVIVGSRMDADYGIDSWTARHREALTEFRETLPDGIELKVLFSQKKYTDERSSHLYRNLAMGMVLVSFVVWLMMGWRAAIPICSALPLTLLMVFFLMLPFGVSLHQMSISGLILALGMLIDNPIIVTDDIQRRLDAGCPPEEAMSASVRHLTVPLVGSNLTTILGFSPILLIPGPTGEYLGQLGWGVIASLSVSLVLALTVIPIIAAWSLRSRFGATFQSGVAPGWFNETLTRLFRHPRLIIGVSLIFPLLGFALSGDLKEQFFPAAERDHFHFSVRVPTSASIRETQRVAQEASRIIETHERVEHVWLVVGTNGPMLHYSMISSDENRPDFAQGIVQLKGGEVDPGLIHELQHKLDEEFPEAQVIVTRLEQGPAATAPIEFRIYGSSLEQLHRLGEEARRIMMTIPGIIQTRSSLDPGGPQFALHLRQHDAEGMKLTDERLASQVRDQLDGVTLTTMSEEIEEVPIRIRLKNGDQTSPDRVISLPIVSPKAGVIPLGSVADWSIDSQLFNISRRNSSRCNIIYGYVVAGQLPIVLEEQFKQALEDNRFTLPAGYRSDFGGVSQERDSAVGNLMAYAAIICVMMVSVLVLTFGSFRQAGIIGVVGILSIGLGLLSLWLFNFPIGIVSIIGLLGMMGLAINDSIVVLTDGKEASARGESLASSVSQSTRHVLTTSLTTVAGVLPLILAGGDFWPPMMIVIAGGVIGATLLALGFTPAVYSVLQPRHEP